MIRHLVAVVEILRAWLRADGGTHLIGGFVLQENGPPLALPAFLHQSVDISLAIRKYFEHALGQGTEVGAKFDGTEMRPLGENSLWLRPVKDVIDVAFTHLSGAVGTVAVLVIFRAGTFTDILRADEHKYIPDSYHGPRVTIIWVLRATSRRPPPLGQEEQQARLYYDLNCDLPQPPLAKDHTRNALRKKPSPSDKPEAR
ncbi:hypothetical protein F5148DRAFT_1280087 [Russula earlei]|uniref:Uncharacterized protein n=1 Tax=Russula earlei TaxID=71964 RepID=A0ACC0UK63_9AGAM|nr:hypothetical protein F5148DRAFT_1280087 [Russula earlei]